MKKTLLFAVAFGTGLALCAQNSVKKIPFSALQDGNGNPNKVVTSPVSPNKNGNPSPNTVSACDTIGHAGNAYGSYTRPGRSMLYADPNCGAIIYTHRSAPTLDMTSNTGNIMYDRSTDGGLTWTANVGPVYVPAGENGRYPQGVIYNPGNQSNPANCFMAGFGPNTNGTNWVSYHNCAQPLMGGTPVQQVFQFGVNSPQGLIPFNSDIQQDGTWRVIDIMNVGPSGYDYNDTLMVNVGTWNTSANRYDMNLSKVYFPVSLDANNLHNLTHAGVAFAKTGGTGYLIVLGHDQQSFAPPFADSASYLIIRKTTDGGTTWGTPSRLCLGTNIDGIMNNVGSGMYTHGFDFDAIVDVNGNLHIAIITSPQATGGGWSVPTTSLKIMSDVYTTDGGNTWYIQKIAETMTFRGDFGTTPISEDNRPQVSANWNRDRLFFSWFDTDTNTFAGQGNAYPDHHVIGANVTNATAIQWTAPQNTTVGSCADGITTFGSVPQYVLSASGIHNIPLSYMVLINNDDLAVCQFRFGEGITVTDASMTVAGSPVQLGCNIGFSEENNNLFSVSNPYPNPSSGNSTFTLNLNTASHVNITLTNTIGQTVNVIADERLAAGKQEINVDGSNLEAGIYFVTVKAGEFSITKKLVINK
ncbi:MAG: T9SS type A sorting domain-containing protein [Bacteroidia bacterium]|nr:T9SS type A sorting domain-containing protein [Bacteroidia bacterium]